MSLSLTNSLRSLFFSRRLAILFAFISLSAVAPYASARTSGTHRHPRLHALAHAFVNATLPGAGLLPEDDDEPPAEGQKYELKLAHGPTGEILDVVYRIGNTYIPEALDKLNLFLRDSHNQEVNAYDPRTFDVLHTMLAKLGKSNGVIDVLSGYRSQETNDMLRESGTTNAAEHSQHILAKAVDLRVPGVPAPLLRDAAKSIGAGGVGYYPASQFVHIDVGPVRQWTFTPHAVRRHSRRSRARARSRHI
ncbi:YcbK family protein [Acidicapsa ligni]|uniref:YcbK family protein n=1 Tax=Acidicapsa ligni TaxID=542300 RepID=UPI0021DFCC20|nr:DUF882 domain-containing protein [Acidicapsa ligni]